MTLGDLTENNTDGEWAYVKDAFALVDRELPLLPATGNHDYGDLGKSNRRFTLFQHYFAELPPPAQRALAETQRVGDVENAYYRIRLPKVTLGVLVLEWTPRSAAVQWADDVLARHPDDRVIVVTHAYLYHDGSRYDWWRKGEKQEWNPLSYGTAKSDVERATTRRNLSPEGAYDGEMLWRALVQRHPGIFLTLSGHVLGDGAGVLTSRGLAGNTVHQILVNYQMLEEGGLGYLRLIELLPDGASLRMKTVSPSLGVWALEADQNGELTVEPPLW